MPDNNARRSICMFTGISADSHRAINKFVGLMHYSFATVYGYGTLSLSLSLFVRTLFFFPFFVYIFFLSQTKEVTLARRVGKWKRVTDVTRLA